MALTNANKADIRYYLGYPNRFYDQHTSFESALDEISNDTDAEALVLADITKLKSIDTSLTASYSRLKATQVGDIKLANTKELMALRSEGRRIVGRVASTLGVEVMKDVFASSSATKFVAPWNYY